MPTRAPTRRGQPPERVHDGDRGRSAGDEKRASTGRPVAPASRNNPVNWAVEAGRGALSSSLDWGLIASRLGLLALLAIVCGWVATRAFYAYQRSI
jgi:hypothetical protein